MYEQGVVDRFEWAHGPRTLLRRYAVLLERDLRELGLRLRISTDFDRMIELSKEQRENWPAPSPAFDPQYCQLTDDNAFLIECVDDFGDTVVTSAGRVYDHGDRSLAEDLRALRIFYDDARPHVATDRVEVTAASAHHIFGRAGYSGAVWVRPDYRRHGLTKIIPRLTRSVLLTRWNTPVFWATISPHLDAIGVTRAYGSWHVENGINLHMPDWQGDFTLLFLSMGQATLIRDIAHSVESYDASTGTSRWIDNAIASKSLSPSRQGTMSRS